MTELELDVLIVKVGAATVRVTVVLAVSDPDVPVIVTS